MLLCRTNLINTAIAIVWAREILNTNRIPLLFLRCCCCLPLTFNLSSVLWIKLLHTAIVNFLFVLSFLVFTPFYIIHFNVVCDRCERDDVVYLLSFFSLLQVDPLSPSIIVFVSFYGELGSFMMRNFDENIIKFFSFYRILIKFVKNLVFLKYSWKIRSKPTQCQAFCNQFSRSFPQKHSPLTRLAEERLFSRIRSQPIHVSKAEDQRNFEISLFSRRVWKKKKSYLV